MNARLTYLLLRCSLPAVVLLVGWTIAWAQFVAIAHNESTPNVSSNGDVGKTVVSKADTMATSPVGKGDWGLPGDNCEAGARDILVFGRLRYDALRWYPIVEVAIVNMGSDDVTVKNVSAGLAQAWLGGMHATMEQTPGNHEILSEAVDDGDHDVSTQPAVNMIRFAPIPQWICGDGRIAGGGVGVVQICEPTRLSSPPSGHEWNVDTVLVFVDVEVVQDGRCTKYKVEFTSRGGGSHARTFGGPPRQAPEQAMRATSCPK